MLFYKKLTTAHPDKNSNGDLYLMTQLVIFKEHIRQAKVSFNLSVVASTLSLTICVLGGILVLTGKATEGTVTTSGGLISTTLCSQMAQASSEKLKQLADDLNRLHASNDM
ncbi:TRADD-N-associated membrane domain-containing protein [Nostoc sp.]